MCDVKYFKKGSSLVEEIGHTFSCFRKRGLPRRQQQRAGVKRDASIPRLLRSI